MASAPGWDELKDIVCTALEMPAGDRGRFLDDTCEGDTALRAEAEQLLLSHEDGREFFRLLEHDLGSSDVDLHCLATGDLVHDRFEVRAFLAMGGSGEVYEAWDRDLGERVALKVLRGRRTPEHAARRFHSEVRLARKIQSPFVCRVHDSGRFTRFNGEPVLFLSMEVLDGETLAAFIRRSGRARLPEAISILRQIARGIDAAHSAGILHRDLKSANVMLVPDRDDSKRAVLTDFGLASLAGESVAGTLTGTPGYMAPEQVEGGTLSTASDVYALGVIAYEILTGRLPFSGATPMDVARARLHSEPPSPRSLNPAIPARWERAILKCLARDPAKRFNSAAAFIAALEKSYRVPTIVGSIAACFLAVIGWIAWNNHLAAAPLDGSVVIARLAPTGSGNTLADAFRDELAASFSSVPGVRVIARTTAERIDTTPAGLADLRRKYRTGALLTGFLQPAENGNASRVSMQLIDTSNAAVLWSGSYTAKPAELSRTGETIVLASLGGLNINLAAPSLRRLEKRHSRNPEAYRSYLFGRHFTARRNTEDLNAAIRYFKTAVAADPDYALAWAGLSTAYSLIATRHDPAIGHDQAFQLSENAAVKALVLDPNLPEALLIRGSNAQRAGWKWDEAEAYFRRSLAAAPEVATGHQWLAGLLSLRGRHQEALAEGLKARELDPISPVLNNAYGMSLYRARRYRDALDYLERLHSENKAFLNVKLNLADVYGQLGRFNDAIAMAEQAVIGADRASWALSDLGYFYGRAGRTNEATEILRELTSRYAEGKAIATQLATVYNGMSNAASAIDWLERGVATRDEGLVVLKVDPAWDWVRGNPRFRKLTESLGL